MDNRAPVGGLEIAIPCIYGALAYFFEQSGLHAAPEVVRIYSHSAIEPWVLALLCGELKEVGHAAG